MTATAGLERDLTQFDPFDPSVQADMTGWFAALRHQDPVHFNEASGYWFITSRAAIDEALSQPLLFSSEMEAAFKLPPPPEVADEVAQIRACGYAREKVLVYCDPPAHDRHRALIGKGFTPRLARRLEPALVALVDDLLDALPTDQPVDFVGSFAAPLPTLVVARLLNVPADRLEDFRRWADARIATAASRLDPDAYVRATIDEVEMQNYLADQLERRRREPGEDLLTSMVQARLSVEDGVEGAPLTTSECVSMLGLLLSAGVDTTTGLLASTMVHFAEHPSLWAWVRDDPRPRSEQVVEESLRMFSPAQAIPRVTTAPAALGGRAIPAGATVFLAFAAANRDEAFYPEPDRFDCARPNARHHRAFGHGKHFCLGAELARLEAAIAWRAMTERYEPPVLCDHNTFPRRQGFVLPALSELFVTLQPRVAVAG